MKSKKAEEAIERYRQAFSAPYQADETAEYCRLFKELAEIAEQEAEERMRAKAIEAFCVDCICASDGKHCSFGDECALKVDFIQKLNEE
nr:MAG TPA: hypothetical protein [Caudoviricetes sp.]